MPSLKQLGTSYRRIDQATDTCPRAGHPASRAGPAEPLAWTAAAKKRPSAERSSAGGSKWLIAAMVLVLFETAVGFCLFSLSDEAKLSSPDLYKSFESEKEANRLLQLSAIHRFQSTADAVEGATAVQEGKLSKGLKKFLQDEIVNKGGSAGAKGRSSDKLYVSEPKLGTSWRCARY